MNRISEYLHTFIGKIKARKLVIGTVGDINRIPEGDYCYKILRIDSGDGRMPVSRTKTCPLYDIITVGKRHYAYCRLVGPSSFNDMLLDDQVKICNENMGEYWSHNPALPYK